MLLRREPTKGEKDPAAWPWLCDRYEISYAPSVTTLDILSRREAARKPRRWDRALFALADPPFSPKQLAEMTAERPPTATAPAAGSPGDALALSRAVRFDKGAVPPRLAGTRREVELVADLFGADRQALLLGADATERNLFAANARGDLKRARYVHIATHGLADNDRPELSALILARAVDDKDYDGVLHMREVFHLKLDADLVVLSACQTGLGKHLRGEGVVGLSTAFFFAGTESLVMSLWDVPDASTALLMHRFYTSLKAGRPKAAALRDAKAWLRNLTRDDLWKLGKADPLLAGLTRGVGRVVRVPKGTQATLRPFTHPHHWAGFVLLGQAR